MNRFGLTHPAALGLGVLLVAATGAGAGERVPPLPPLGVLRVPESLLRDSGVPVPVRFDRSPDARPEPQREPAAEPGGACLLGGDGEVLYSRPGKTCG